MGSEVGGCIHMLGGWPTPTPQGQKLLGSEAFQTLPYVPVDLAVHLYLCNILCNKLVSVSKYFQVLSPNYLVVIISKFCLANYPT